MKTIRKFFPVIALFVSTFLIAEEMPVTLVLPDGEKDRWEMAFSHIENGEAILEFIPKNESLDNWSEMITLQYFPDNIFKVALKPRDLMDAIWAKMIELCTNVSWSVLNDKEDDVVYEWITKDCLGVDDQDEIARLTRESAGITRMAYVKKGERMDDSLRHKWLEWIRS